MLRILLYFLLFASTCQAQDLFIESNKSMGIGVYGGYRTIPGTGGVFLEYKHHTKFSIDTGFGASKGLGFGGFLGANYFFFPAYFQPFVHISSNYFLGENLNTGNYTTGISKYQTTPSGFAQFGMGIRLLKHSSNPLSKGYLGISLLGSYRIAYLQGSLSKISGIGNLNYENSIRLDIKSGFGFGIKATYYLPKLAKIS